MLGLPSILGGLWKASEPMEAVGRPVAVLGEVYGRALGRVWEVIGWLWEALGSAGRGLSKLVDRKTLSFIMQSGDPEECLPRLTPYKGCPGRPPGCHFE